MKPLLITTGMVLGLMAFSGFWSSRAARTNLKDTTTLNLTLSNDLAAAKSSIAAKQSAFETLDIQRGLLASDLQTARDEISLLRTNLAKATLERAALEKAAQKVNGDIQSLTKQFEEQFQSIGSEQRRAIAAEARLAEVGSEFQIVREELKNLQKRLNENETLLREMQVRWSDPSALRAQLNSVSKGSHGTSPRIRGLLELKPDGSVCISK